MPPTLTRHFLLLAISLLVGCAGMGDELMLSGTDALAKGKILPVNESPKTLGRKRLDAYADRLPVLKSHFEEHGFPDRLIETITFGSQRKVVMYYTKQGVAYLLIADRFAKAKSKIVGPSPIGPKTKELFAAMDNLQKVSEDVAKTKE